MVQVSKVEHNNNLQIPAHILHFLLSVANFWKFFRLKLFTKEVNILYIIEGAKLFVI